MSYKCEKCNTEYISQKRYLTHLETCVYSNGNSPFKCEECGNEYMSQKQYLTHVELCQSDKRTIRSQSTYKNDNDSVITTTTMTTSEKFKRAIEKLMNDKTRLKEDVKKYDKEIRLKVEEHREELEQTHEQIDRLTEERDKLLKKLLDSEEKVSREKERLRNEFVKKIATEKKKLEADYDGKNNGVIEKLQNALNSKVEEQEQMQMMYETQLSEKDENYASQIEELNERLRYVITTASNDRNEIQRLTSSHDIEKDLLKRNHDNEKELILSEMKVSMKIVEDDKDSLEKEITRMSKDHQNIIDQIKAEHDTVIRDRDSVIIKLRDMIRVNEENNQNILSGKIDSLTKQFSQEKEKYMNEMEEKMNSLDITDQNIRDAIVMDANNKIAMYKDEADQCKKKYDEIKGNWKKMLSKRENELKVFYEGKLKEYVEQMDSREQKIIDETNESLREKDRIIDDIQTMNHTLGSQATHYRSSIDRIKSDTDRIKEQFIVNLNKQKEDSDFIIKGHEKHISELEAEITEIHSECANKLLRSKHIYDELNDSIEIVKKQYNDQIGDMIIEIENHKGKLRETEQQMELMKMEYVEQIRNLTETIPKNQSEELQFELEKTKDRLLESQKLCETFKQQAVNQKNHLVQKMKDIEYSFSTEREELISVKNDLDNELKILKIRLEENEKFRNQLNNELLSLKNKFILVNNELIIEKGKMGNTVLTLTE